MLLVSVVVVERQKQSSSWQTYAAGDVSPYGAGEKQLAQ
jgi:hypothetical protein